MKERYESLLSVRDVKEKCSLLIRNKLLRLIADLKKSKSAEKVVCHYWLLQHHDVLKVKEVYKRRVPATDENFM